MGQEGQGKGKNTKTWGPWRAGVSSKALGKNVTVPWNTDSRPPPHSMLMNYNKPFY